MPQRRAQTDAKAASAHVDGLHQPGHDQGRRPERPGRLGILVRRPDEAKVWSEIYYDIIKSDVCVPLGHSVNANLALVSAFSVHEDRQEAIRRGQEGFEFFGYALQSLVARDSARTLEDLGDVSGHAQARQ